MRECKTMPGFIGSLLLLICLFSPYCSGNSEIQDRTYPHTLDNGDRITCLNCQPGFFFLRPCISGGGNSTCEKCPDEFFNSEYTVARTCAPCSRVCPRREYIAKNCTPVSNISCLCREGFYRDPVKFGLCLTINPCSPGQGVIKEGYGLADTVCEDCPSGYFSAISSKTEPCQECRRCLQGKVEASPCRSHVDRTCQVPGADALPTEAIIGIVAGSAVVLIIIVIVVCCFCVMKKKCARVRKRLCKCWYRQYEECTQQEKSGSMKNGTIEFHNIGDVHNNPSVPDILKNMNEPPPCVPDKVFYMLREDLISQEYPQFFRFLFTNEADRHINEMKLDHSPHGVQEIIYQILLKWREIEQGNATPEQILTALQEWNRPDLVKKYREVFSDRQENGKSRNNSKSSVSTDV